MGKLLSAVLFIVIFCFSLVFSFDRRLNKNTRLALVITALISAIIGIVVIYLILSNPF